MSRAGLTLLELMVGIVLAGIAVSLVAGIYTTTSASLVRTNVVVDHHERRALARAWLTQALSSVNVSADADGYFHGSSDTIGFRSSMWVPEGWLEDGRVEITASRAALALRFADLDRIMLLDSLDELRFDFRGRVGADAPWLERWHSFSSPPVAVRLRYARAGLVPDTMLFYIGER